MTAEFYRKDYGETEQGYVSVIGFRGGSDDNGLPTVTRYEVRRGAHTVGTYGTEAEADMPARALVGAIAAMPVVEVEEAAAEPVAARPSGNKR